MGDSGAMKSGTKYGLQLRGPPAGAPKKALPPPPKPSIFTQDDDDDEESVEQEIGRQAAKNRSLEQVSLLHQAALEQDSTAFAYDEVYDDIKAKSAPVQKTNPEELKSKYIPKLLAKAKSRQQEQEIIYERRLLKEREREDHLYGDKDKFLTTAYKQKLQEQAQWLEEENQRERREEANEVTKKKDLGDFYQNLLSKNVAFGASTHKVDMSTAPEKALQVEQEEHAVAGGHAADLDLDKSSRQEGQFLEVQSDDKRTSSERKRSLSPRAGKAEPDDGSEGSQKSRGKDSVVVDILAKPEHKPSEDELSSAKERYLARKRMRAA